MNRGFFVYADTEEMDRKVSLLESCELDSIHGAKRGDEQQYLFTDYIVDVTEDGDCIYVVSAEELGNNIEQQIDSLEYIMANNIVLRFVNGVNKEVMFGLNADMVDMAGSLIGMLVTAGKIK